MKPALVVLVFLLVSSCGGAPPPGTTIGNRDAPETGPVKRQELAFSKGTGLELKVVDHGSGYMTGLHARAAQDPAAAQAGIKVDQEEWLDGTTRHRDQFLTAPDREVLVRYITELAAADRGFAPPADRELALGQVDNKWRTYLVHRRVELDGTSIASASMVYDPTTAQPFVLIEFTRTGAVALADLTARITGKKLAMLLDGVVKSAPVINATIHGGRASIAMGGGDPVEQEKEATALVRTLQQRR
jgi:preprotein translocase subunit SecD